MTAERAHPGASEAPTSSTGSLHVGAGASGSEAYSAEAA